MGGCVTPGERLRCPRRAAPAVEAAAVVGQVWPCATRRQRCASAGEEAATVWSWCRTPQRRGRGAARRSSRHAARRGGGWLREWRQESREYRFLQLELASWVRMLGHVEAHQGKLHTILLSISGCIQIGKISVLFIFTFKPEHSLNSIKKIWSLDISSGDGCANRAASSA